MRQFNRAEAWRWTSTRPWVLELGVLLVVGCQSQKVGQVVTADDAVSSMGADVAAAPPGTCPAKTVLGCVTDYSYRACNDAGTGFTEVKCGTSEVCFGAGECKKAKCVPEKRTCISPTKAAQCKPDGSGYDVTETCEAGTVCDQPSGTCVSSCLNGAKATTNVGCSYFVVDLGNYDSVVENNVKDQPVLVAIANASKSIEAHVTLTAMGDNVFAEGQAVTVNVPPNQLRTVALPTGFAQLDSSINRWSWKVVSDQPVTLHQFNPLNGQEVHSSDASLLFPNDALGSEYVVMSWRSFFTDALGFDAVTSYPKYGFPNYVTVVAASTGKTKVSITASADVRPTGPNTPKKAAVAAIKKGETKEYELDHGDVLTYTIHPKLEDNLDLTGTVIKADKGIAVFMSHNCAFVPSVEVKYCDHLEHALTPVTTWSSVYVADLFHKRSAAAYDVFRIMAAQAQTVIHTEPPVPGVDGKILGKYEWVEYQATASHLVKSTAPIQMGHYLIGSNYPGNDPICQNGVTGIGDPSFTIGVGESQWLKEYIVLTPTGYKESWFNLIRHKGEVITIDGTSVEGYVEKPIETLGSSDVEVLRLKVEAGVHRLVADKPFGVTAYAYDCDVSYAYPGGLLLVPGNAP